jgi:SAM-dependent methyltransferase
MNENHARVCPSPEWAQYLQDEVIPEVSHGVSLGEELLEVGPGPGAATEVLRHRVKRLVAIELEEPAAAALAQRHAGTNVEVVIGDATALPFPDDSFDSAASFTMLHHVPTAALQNRLLAEILRVLRPGGALIGSDSLASDDLHQFHEGDTYNPVEPAAFLTRLQTIGYENITLTVDHALKFRGYKPGGADASANEWRQ